MLKDADEFRIAHAPSVIDQVVEAMVLANYPVQRQGDCELLIDIPGEISRYTFYVCWWPEQNCFMQTAMIDLVMDEENAQFYKLLSLVNSQLLYGHFDLDPDHGTLMFRQTQVVPHDTNLAKELVDLFIQEAIDYCEQYFASFLLVLRDGRDAEQALIDGSKAVDGLA